MGKLTAEKITSELKRLPGWKFMNNCIVKEFTFASYMAGIAFVNQVATLAETHNHHPDLGVGWCRVKVSFTSHDTGGVTERDIHMAQEVSHLVES
ncbi:MAG: 4a-hydroxytetrahydrobiopterin dehydratase [Fidelibacterota bacterium]